MAQANPILVTGGTGRLGRLIVEGLVAQGQPVRVFTRRREEARTLLGDAIDIATGDFADAASLDAALAGVERLLLLAPISATLVRDQLAVLAAAERRGVRRIVKISGSHWTIDPPGQSIAGDAHAEVEAGLARSSLETVALRPNAWMQVSLAGLVARVKAGTPLFAPPDDRGVGYIDAREIADVAVHQLRAARLESSPLVLTGGKVVTAREIAALIGQARGAPVVLTGEPPPPRPVHDPFEARAVAEFGVLMRAGRAAEVTDTVQHLLGRPPRSVEAFIAEQFGA